MSVEKTEKARLEEGLKSATQRRIISLRGRSSTLHFDVDHNKDTEQVLKKKISQILLQSKDSSKILTEDRVKKPVDELVVLASELTGVPVEKPVELVPAAKADLPKENVVKEEVPKEAPAKEDGPKEVVAKDVPAEGCPKEEPPKVVEEERKQKKDYLKTRRPIASDINPPLSKVERCNGKTAHNLSFYKRPFRVIGKKPWEYAMRDLGTVDTLFNRYGYVTENERKEEDGNNEGSPMEVTKEEVPTIRRAKSNYHCGSEEAKAEIHTDRKAKANDLGGSEVTKEKVPTVRKAKSNYFCGSEEAKVDIHTARRDKVMEFNPPLSKLGRCKDTTEHNLSFYKRKFNKVHAGQPWECAMRELGSVDTLLNRYGYVEKHERRKDSHE